MSEDHNNLIPFYQLDRICENQFLSAELGMLAKRGEISTSIMKDRAGDIRALDTATVQKLIDKGVLQLCAPNDILAWEFVGGYDAFMQKHGLKPKA